MRIDLAAELVRDAGKQQGHCREPEIRDDHQIDVPFGTLVAMRNRAEHEGHVNAACRESFPQHLKQT